MSPSPGLGERGRLASSILSQGKEAEPAGPSRGERDRPSIRGPHRIRREALTEREPGPRAPVPIENPHVPLTRLFIEHGERDAATVGRQTRDHVGISLLGHRRGFPVTVDPHQRGPDSRSIDEINEGAFLRYVELCRPIVAVHVERRQPELRL